jgi:large subunit ribosomal protein L18
VGQKIAERLKEAKVKTVIFDRNGYRYHGIVKAVADGARESGLDF